jgi:hypothetical protein
MDTVRERVYLGKWDFYGFNRMLREGAAIPDSRRRIEYISRQFLGVPYGEATLVGSPDAPEELVIDFRSVDCFTYIDYVEAMRLSDSLESFKEQLRMVRYRKESVEYVMRRHFFIDWIETPRLRDVSVEVAHGQARAVKKVLNRRSDGSLLLPGIPEKKREVTFIPGEAVTDATLDRLHTGDYIGIFSDREELDVSHVGIIVKREGCILFRHASLLERMVVDQDSREYLSGKPGIIVLRPQE